MKSLEPLIRQDSDYYVYLPSTVAAKIYFSPLIIGHFYYEPGYYLKRNYYENYLLIFLQRGAMTLKYQGKESVVRENQVVLIDCRKPHEYGNASFDEILETAWIHFDGPLAANYYELITASYGNVISMANPYEIIHNLAKIYRFFTTSAPIREGAVSAYITRMLSELVSIRQEQAGETSRPEVIESSVAYINEHFREPISLEEIARHASLSPYYFTRIFTAETGFTPHQYVIATRINQAKYLLQTGEMNIKEIAFACGFSSESSFCSTFRKWEKMTPGRFRCGAGSVHKKQQEK